jgi:patatin-related protein
MSPTTVQSPRPESDLPSRERPAAAEAIAGGSSQQEEKTREVRLGLVLYGGVSLAIYINGVVREFFRAVRGQGVYRLAKVLTDSDVVVDIISGTSAGGINGILLAYAICNNRDFADSATLWRRDGSIRDLLGDPFRRDWRRMSLLDSEGYYQPALEAAFKYMGPYVPEAGEEPSDVNQLDLFVTGTDVDGSVYTRFDDAGHPIDVKDHRTVFLLKHRKDRKEPFNPRPRDLSPKAAPLYEASTHEALAKLARITSCFPAAFAPVRVRLHEKGDRSEGPVFSADALLQEWGRMGKEACFLDGGILDNKPFTHALDAIFAHSADRAVDRKLLYVEPDPECFRPHDAASEPDFIQAVVASLIGIPGYESISEDLKTLAQHNSNVERYRRIIAESEPAAINSDTPYPTTAERQALPRGPGQKLYERSRLVALSERVMQGVLRKDGRNDVLEIDERQVAAELIRSFDDTFREGSAGKASVMKPQAFFREFDVYYRQRRVHQANDRIYDLLHPDSATQVDRAALSAKHRLVWQACNRLLKLLDLIRAALETVMDEVPIQWKGRSAIDIWVDVRVMLRALLDEADPFTSLPRVYSAGEEGSDSAWLDLSTLNAFRQEIFSRARGLVEEWQKPLASQDPALRAKWKEYAALERPQGSRNVLTRCDEYARQIMGQHLHEDDPVRMVYEQFEALDELLFPIELAAGLRTKRAIETVRISPRDATKGFSQQGFSDKVAGDAFYHFGGFFKRSWRSNDILWGRLDGLCQLVECLLPPDRLRQVVESESLRQAIRGRLYEDYAAKKWRPEFDPATLFPHGGRGTRERLGVWLHQLVSDDSSERAQALDAFGAGPASPAQSSTPIQSLLIEAAQLEVIHGELPNVISDSIEEQAEWRQVPVREDARRRIPQGPSSGGSVPVESWLFKPLDPEVNPFVSIVAAAERMREAMGGLAGQEDAANTPRETALGKFFVNSYRVGAERLTRDVPPLVLLEILAVALLAVRDCMLTAFGERGERLRGNPIYRLTLSLPLRVFHLLVFGWRRAQGRRAVFRVIAGLALLTVGFCGWKLVTGVSLTYQGDGVPWTLLALTGGALLILTFQALIGYYGQLRDGEHAAPVSLTMTRTEPDSWLDAAMTAECRVREERRQVEVVLRGFTVGLRNPEAQADGVTLSALRVGLEVIRGGADAGPTSQGDLIAQSRWRRIRRVVGADRREVIGSPRFVIDLPEGARLEQLGLVVLLEQESGPRDWRRLWRRRQFVSRVRGRRRLRDTTPIAR